MKGLVDCELSVEHVRQRVSSKVRINLFHAFSQMDALGKGSLEREDFRVFCKKNNFYPIERELGLLFERFDKDKDQVVSYEEFAATLTPFSNPELY